MGLPAIKNAARCVSMNEKQGKARPALAFRGDIPGGCHDFSGDA